MSKEPIGTIVNKYDASFLSAKKVVQIDISEDSKLRLGQIGSAIKQIANLNLSTYDGIINYLIDAYLEV